MKTFVWVIGVTTLFDIILQHLFTGALNRKDRVVLATLFAGPLVTLLVFWENRNSARKIPVDLVELGVAVGVIIVYVRLIWNGRD